MNKGLSEREQKIAALTSSSTEFRREIGLFDGIMVVVGNTIGSGIFIAPAVVAATVMPQTGGMVLLVWLAGGMLAITGALSYSELGALMPRAGGHYVFLREGFGKLAGFLYGWILLLVIASGSIAFVSITFVTYLGYFIPMPPGVIKFVAIGTIILLTWVNHRGVRPGSIVLNIFTVLKILALVALIVGGLVFDAFRSDNFLPLFPGAAAFDLMGVSTFLFALVAALFTYGGWQNIGFIAGEIKDPHRTLPLSLILGCIIIITIYVLTNTVFVNVLSVPAMGTSGLVASDAMDRLAGDLGGGIISLMIMVSSFGITNAIIMVSPRVYYAMAKDGVFFSGLAKVHPRFKTPSQALLVQAVWATLIVILSETFQQIMNYVVFVDWLYLALAVSCVYILRRKYPEARRPYRVWGYPVTPAVFILMSAAVVVNTLIRAPIESGIGMAIVLTGIPAYMFWQRQSAGNETIKKEERSDL